MTAKRSRTVVRFADTDEVEESSICSENSAADCLGNEEDKDGGFMVYGDDHDKLNDGENPTNALSLPNLHTPPFINGKASMTTKRSPTVVHFADSAPFIIPYDRQVDDRLQWISAFRLKKISNQMMTDVSSQSDDDRINENLLPLLEGDIDATIDENREIQLLLDLYQNNETVRGLEKYVANGDHGRQMEKIKNDTKSAVLILQDHLRRRNQRISDNIISEDSIQEALAAASSKASSKARRYARLAAIADERVVKAMIGQHAEEHHHNGDHPHQQQQHVKAAEGQLMQILPSLREIPEEDEEERQPAKIKKKKRRSTRLLSKLKTGFSFTSRSRRVSSSSSLLLSHSINAGVCNHSSLVGSNPAA